MQRMLLGRQPHFCICMGLCWGTASSVLPIFFDIDHDLQVPACFIACCGMLP